MEGDEGKDISQLLGERGRSNTVMWVAAVGFQGYLHTGSLFKVVALRARSGGLQGVTTAAVLTVGGWVWGQGEGIRLYGGKGREGEGIPAVWREGEGIPAVLGGLTSGAFSALWELWQLSTVTAPLLQWGSSSSSRIIVPLDTVSIRTRGCLLLVVVVVAAMMFKRRDRVHIVHTYKSAAAAVDRAKLV